ncbi:hypothetical protein J7M23_07490 [Candidatus Sumerlaeota bacterium]|nr:hypothetical protein [Candidatus Sumerlaeota bacterium]
MKGVLIKLRRNHLLILFTLGFFITLGALLLEIDRQYFQTKKRLYINENWNTIFPLDKEKLTLKSRQILEASTPAQREQFKSELTKDITEILEGPLSIYSIKLVKQVDEHYVEVVSKTAPQKLKKCNTFKNCLFVRKFRGTADLMISSSTGKETLGRLLVLYTTPPDDKYIEQLTATYRYYSLIIFVVVGLIYFYILRFLLLPVKRVIGCLDKAKSQAPEIIASPGSYLERVYNNLSRDALLSRINHKLNAIASTTPLPELTKVYQQLPDVIIQLFNYPVVMFLELKKTNEEPYTIVTCFSNTDQKNDDLINAIKSQLIAMVQTSDIGSPERSLAFGSKLHYLNQQKCWWFVDIIHHTPEYDAIDCMVIVPAIQSEKELSEWDVETLRLIARQLRDGINAIELRRQSIFKEKSETNINLARRLGHDLTNIIATSKLDLLSIKNYLEADDQDTIRHPQKKELFRQALNGLLNNTRFLQEIVDIYNSFSFVKHPVYKKVNINQLLDEIVDVFQMAMSRNVNVSKNYQSDLPECVVEERLLKLALFNLLSNALEAVSSHQGSLAQKNTIDITTRHNPDNDEIYISVRDYGSGIRSPDGRLLRDSEINKIFLPGYTTKRDDGGEGLGLNWVWIIISEFHNGRITAENCPDGGAQFTLCLNRSVLAEKLSRQQNAMKISHSS